MRRKGDKNSSVVFCDFDGTITSEESLEGVFKKFTPELWTPMKDKLMALEITLREGVRKLIEAIPSKRYPEILDYVQQIPIRQGFEDMLDFLDVHQIPFVIVSGGIRGMVDARMGCLAKRAKEIFALDVNTEGEFLKVSSAYEGDTELMDKVRVMNLFDAGQTIVIGDGATDIHMAQQGSVVFARGSLAFFLKHMGVEYREWSDFFDIRNELEKWWEKS